MNVAVIMVDMAEIRAHLTRATALLNSCALVQTEPATYSGLVDALGEVRRADDKAKAAEILGQRGALAVADGIWQMAGEVVS